MKADRAATEAAGFADKRSYICWDGREVLYGLDWKKRKLELWKRCGGKCEHIILSYSQFEGHVPPTTFGQCPAQAEHPHHKIKRSIIRDDRMCNLIALCAYHHQQQHPEKQTRFGEGRDESTESSESS